MTETTTETTETTERVERCAVPLERSEVGLIHVRAAVGERALRLIVDTGANRTVLDRAAAEAIGVEEREAGGDVTSCVGLEGAGQAQIGALRVGPIEIPPGEVTLLDLGPMKPQLGEVDGILGADVLTATEAVIDYASLELRVRQPGSSGEA